MNVKENKTKKDELNYEEENDLITKWKKIQKESEKNKNQEKENKKYFDEKTKKDLKVTNMPVSEKRPRVNMNGEAFEPPEIYQYDYIFQEGNDNAQQKLNALHEEHTILSDKSDSILDQIGMLRLQMNQLSLGEKISKSVSKKVPLPQNNLPPTVYTGNIFMKYFDKNLEFNKIKKMNPGQIKTYIQNNDWTLGNVKDVFQLIRTELLKQDKQSDGSIQFQYNGIRIIYELKNHKKEELIDLIVIGIEYAISINPARILPVY